MYDPYADFKSVTLENGLTIHHLHMPGRESVVCRNIVHSGGRHDPAGVEGVAHYLEHLFSKNAPLPYDKLKDYFRERGVDARFGSTYWGATSYEFISPASIQTFGECVNMYGAMLCENSLTERMEGERGVIIGEFNRKYGQRVLFDEELGTNRILHKDNFLSRMTTSLGSPETINAMTLDHVRAFYEAHYRAPNMSIVCVGGLSLDEVVQAYRASPFGSMVRDGVRNPLAVPVCDPENASVNYRELSLGDILGTEKRPEHGCALISSKIPAMSNIKPAVYALNIINEIMVDELRTKRSWTYAPETKLTELGDFSMVVIGTGQIPPEAVGEAADVLWGCIELLPSKRELFEQRRKETFLRSSLWDVTMENICNGARSDLIELHRIETRVEEYDRIRAITFDDVLDVLKWITPDHSLVTLVRP